MTGTSSLPEVREIRSLKDVDPEELRAIRENIRWFRRFSPLERLRVAAEHAELTARLQRMKPVGRHGS